MKNTPKDLIKIFTDCDFTILRFGKSKISFFINFLKLIIKECSNFQDANYSQLQHSMQSVCKSERLSESQKDYCT